MVGATVAVAARPAAVAFESPLDAFCGQSRDIWPGILHE